MANLMQAFHRRTGDRMKRKLSPATLIDVIMRPFKTLFFWLGRGAHYRQGFYHPLLVQAASRLPRHSHIADHLSTLFFFALDARPKLMVELGTGPGNSTRVLLAAASITNSTLLSVDRKDCGGLDLPFKERWHFVQSDDIAFGRTGFVQWCSSHNLQPQIDFLFIDTSHWYEQTKQEIEIWGPFLSAHGIMVLHDTNMGKGPYGRMDGSIGYGYDNERGVIRVLEELLGRRYDERQFFCDFAEGLLIMHHPHSAGLAVLKKYGQTARE
jgi:hypothetical protein